MKKLMCIFFPYEVYRLRKLVVTVVTLNQLKCVIW